MTEAMVRLGGFAGPAVCVLWLVFWRKPCRRLAGVALLACFWNLGTLLLLNSLAQKFGWWVFDAHRGLLFGMPAELYFGWALLWGAIPVLAFCNLSAWVGIVFMLALDLILMPLCFPVIRLGKTWLIGEMAALILVLIPALFLARWSFRRERLIARTALLVVGYGIFVFLFLPTMAMEAAGISWEQVFVRPIFPKHVVLSIFFLISVPALSAVQEFCQRGLGTPLPFDPPRRLVTSGPFAYIANPMQAVTVWLITGMAFWISDSLVAGIALVCSISTVTIANWQEDAEMARQFGNAWTAHRTRVRSWWPRWTPRFAVPCTIYIAETCHPCRGVACWLRSKQLHGLQIVAAETHPARDFRRITYDAPGWTESGVGAFARSLEHIHLGWAWLGWFLRLPITLHVLQWLVDLAGGKPRKTETR